MKTNIILPATILILVVNSACERNNIEIKYPEYGDYGENIIQIGSFNITSSGSGAGEYFSLRAELPTGTSLKIIMRNKSVGDGKWFFNTSTCIGWSIDTYSTINDSQQILAYGQVICDVKMFFTFSGSAEIEIYENKAASPTRIKTINW